jgi:demethylmenaquinone methyltransferase/2-methoxy-6-polyprenyl-1,4-benzoquinol methylase
MSEEVKQLFTSISSTYDLLNHVMSFQVDKNWRKKTIACIQGGQNIIKALDLCAGTLDLSLEFLKQFPQSMVTAVDFSHAMLEHGLPKIPEHQKNQISIVCADALHLPFDSACFDVIFCGYGFRNLDDQEAGVKEIKRVLKPGGQVLILEFFRPESILSRLFHFTYGRFLIPLIGGLISKSRQAYQYLHDSISRFYSLSECRQLFLNEGFQIQTSRHFMRGISSLIVATKGIEP